MYILVFHGRYELCQMYVSESIPLLKMKAQEEKDNNITFEQINENIFVMEDDDEIGVIGPIEELKSGVSFID